MSLLRVKALPANEGDCLIVEYGDPQQPHRILIDGGRRQTYDKHLKPYLTALPEADRRIDLFVVTHIDRDHIDGALALAEDLAFPVAVDDIWFNGYQHLTGGLLSILGAAQAERFTAAIRARKTWPWNKAFDGKAVALGDGPAPVVKPLPLDASVRLLSPDAKKLAALAPVWKTECERVGLVAGRFATLRTSGAATLPVLKPRTEIDLAALAALKTPIDTAEANGSSIAFLFEYAGRRILFGADAHPGLLLASVREAGADTRLKLDLLKLSHHGSRGNTTTALCAAVDCADFLVSTSGSIFAHPDQEAIARVITASPDAKRVHFNYRSTVTQSWDAPPLIEKYGYRPTYPAQAGEGYCVIEIGACGTERTI